MTTVRSVITPKLNGCIVTYARQMHGILRE